MQARYVDYLASLGPNDAGGCNFCQLTQPNAALHHDERIEWSGEHFAVATNRFPYAVWDGAGVDSHLIIIPKRHVDSVGHFSPEESEEWRQTAARYEAQNYSIYARAAGNAAKSIAHQHTHLIRTLPRPKRLRRAVHAWRIFFATK